MNISIFGLGYVGCVSLGCLAKNGHTIIGVDVSRIKIDQINSGKATIIEKEIDEIISEQHKNNRISATSDFKKAILETEISIVAVGTPSTAQGHLNLDYIFKVAENFAEALKEKNEFHIIAIRSTILPGTCDKFTSIIEENSNKKRDVDFAVVDNPEFLREGTAVEDYFNPPLTLIGAENKEAANKLAELYKTLPAEIYITGTRTAEIMKYVNNTYHALKISFANEIGNICKALGIDSYEVMDIFVKDRQLNISPYYFKPGFAYGGSCLPKDLKALQTLAHDNYVKVPVIENVDKTNQLQIERAIEYISGFKGKKLGFLGLSFKAGTDDLRNSPAVTLIEALLGKGFEIKIFDKNVQLARLTGTNKEYIDEKIPHLTKLLVAEINELIEESDVLIVTNNEKEFESHLKNTHNKPVIDFVRLRDETIRQKQGYYGINW
ncbi:MAG: UDP-glucose/GDP-mannose dehydrogenase family protein [Bacteroidales bacterium]|nr:UDP-glucose/GDP-mannose dehydrogenase family protein [Bacteroidales bacterium]